MPNFFDGFRTWLFGKNNEEIDVNEFERIESKHNRIRHDQDIDEHIRVD